MEEIKVSVIIPVYNATTEMLDRSIGSVLSQKHTNIEIIVVEDCSTVVDTRAYLRDLSDNNSRLSVYYNERNIGISSSRNKGLELATGRYICFLDQDDFYKDSFVDELLATAIAGHAPIAICGVGVIDPSDECSDIRQVFPHEDMDTESAWFPWSICTIWNRIYERRFLLANNIRFPDGCVTEDIVFLMQCNYLCGRVSVIREPLYCCVTHDKSTSRSRAFHELSIQQIPFEQIKDILEKGSIGRYLYASVCNELSLIGGVLTIGSDMATVKEVANQIDMIMSVAIKGKHVKDINEFNAYCGDRRTMRIMNVFMHLSCKMHICKLYVFLLHIFGSFVYNRFYVRKAI